MNIALIAHDNKKKLMENLCIAYRHILIKHNLFATGGTGRLVEETANLSVHKYLAGHLGGEQQLGAQVANNDIDLVIFQSRSPTCGVNQIYDGSFTGKLISGMGLFAKELKQRGYKVIDVEEI